MAVEALLLFSMNLPPEIVPGHFLIGTVIAECTADRGLV